MDHLRMTNIDIRQINIFGKGGHASVIQNTIEKYTDFNCNVTLYDNDDYNLSNDGFWVIAIGDNKARQRVYEKLKNKLFLTIIHNQSNCDIIPGVGSQIMMGAIVQCNVQIGNHSIINTSSSIDHDCKIGSFVHIAPNSTLCGNVKIGDGTLIGAGSVIIPNIKVGKNCIVGAGSVVIKDIPDNKTYLGNPASEKIIK